MVLLPRFPEELENCVKIIFEKVVKISLLFLQSLKYLPISLRSIIMDQFWREPCFKNFLSFKIQGTRFDNCNTLYLCLKLDYSQREGGEGSKPSLFNFPGRGNRRGCIEGRESASRRICERVCEVEQMMLSGRLI